MTPIQVRNAVTAALRKNKAVKEVRATSDAELAVTSEGIGGELNISVLNVRDALNATKDPDDRRRTFRNYVASVSGMIDERRHGAAPMSAETYRRSLFLVVRNRDYLKSLEEIDRRTGGKAPQPIMRTVVADVIAHVALDLPTSTRLVSSGDGLAYGISDDQAYEIGLSNLRKAAGRVTVYQFGRVSALAYDENYNAALLLSNVWASLPQALGDDLLVAVPARDLIAFGSAKDPRAVAALRGIADLPDRGYPVTKRLLRRSGNGWTAFE